MSIKLTASEQIIQNRKVILPTTILLIWVLITIALDFLEARFQHSSFYLSESFLFSSFWWLFLPLLYGQFAFMQTHQMRRAIIAGVLLPMVAHLFAFPALVWLISAWFYHHTFGYWQTFQFGLTEHIFQLLLVYILLAGVYRIFRESIPSQLKLPTHLIPSSKRAFVTSFIVTEGNKRVLIETRDILFFSANAPYVNIHHRTKKYLYHATLKSVLEKIDDRWFVRVHKFAIVNLLAVQSYRSRLNGDYDLTMSDGTELRLSRNYAKAFKVKIAAGPQDTVV